MSMTTLICGKQHLVLSLCTTLFLLLVNPGSSNAADRNNLGNYFSDVPQGLIIQYNTENGSDWQNEARLLSLSTGLGISYVRKLAVNRRHVFKLRRRLTNSRLLLLLQRIAGRVGIVSVEEDVLMQPTFTPGLVELKVFVSSN